MRMIRAFLVPLAAAASAAAGQTATEPPPATSGQAAPPPAPQTAPDPAAGLYLVPPSVDFPREALRAGIDGRCDVLFRVDEQGVPQVIRPTCNSPLFEAAAVRGMMRARLNMAFEGVRPGEWYSLPLIFRIDPVTSPPEG